MLCILTWDRLITVILKCIRKLFKCTVSMFNKVSVDSHHLYEQNVLGGLNDFYNCKGVPNQFKNHCMSILEPPSEAGGPTLYSQCIQKLRP